MFRYDKAVFRKITPYLLFAVEIFWQEIWRNNCSYYFTEKVGAN